MTMFSFISSRS